MSDDVGKFYPVLLIQYKYRPLRQFVAKKFTNDRNQRTSVRFYMKRRKILMDGSLIRKKKRLWVSWFLFRISDSVQEVRTINK